MPNKNSEFTISNENDKKEQVNEILNAIRAEAKIKIKNTSQNATLIQAARAVFSFFGAFTLYAYGYLKEAESGLESFIDFTSIESLSFNFFFDSSVSSLCVMLFHILLFQIITLSILISTLVKTKKFKRDFLEREKGPDSTSEEYTIYENRKIVQYASQRFSAVYKCIYIKITSLILFLICFSYFHFDAQTAGDFVSNFESIIRKVLIKLESPDNIVLLCVGLFIALATGYILKSDAHELWLSRCLHALAGLSLCLVVIFGEQKLDSVLGSNECVTITLPEADAPQWNKEKLPVIPIVRTETGWIVKVFGAEKRFLVINTSQQFYAASTRCQIDENQTTKIQSFNFLIDT